MQTRILAAHPAWLIVIVVGLYFSTAPMVVPGSASTPVADPGVGLVEQPRYGYPETTNIRSWNDINYDTARDIVYKVTLTSVFTAFFWALYRMTRVTTRQMNLESFILASIPAIVYIAGSLLIMNVGGIGAE